MDDNELKGNELKAAVRNVLDRHALGAARMAEHDGEIYVFLEEDRSNHLGTHLATSDIEQLAGRTVQIKMLANLHPVELASVQQQAVGI